MEYGLNLGVGTCQIHNTFDIKSDVIFGVQQYNNTEYLCLLIPVLLILHGN